MSGDLFDGMYDTAPAEEKASSEKGNDAPKAAFAPLAERMRPKTLDEVVGQQHLIGPGAPLRVAFENHRPHSMILWGPPGVGKTTLARLMADAFDLPFLSISAVLGGLKDIREAVDFAKAERKATGRPTLLFVDEVHRFNKSQQDAFLPHVESGLFIFVGATTENPSFEVVSALLSRATVYQLESLKPEESRTLLDRVMTREFPTLKLTEEAVEVIVGLSDGDARRLLNAVDVACTMAKERRVEEITGGRMAESSVYVGDGVPFNMALRLVKDKGEVVVAGYSVRSGHTIDVSVVLQKQLKLIGVADGYGEMSSAINLLANRIIKTDGLINSRIDFSEVPEMVVQCAEYPYQYNKIVVNID